MLNFTKAYMASFSYFKSEKKMGKQDSNDKSQETAEVLQALDENNHPWVAAWKKAVKKGAKSKTES